VPLDLRPREMRGCASDPLVIVYIGGKLKPNGLRPRHPLRRPRDECQEREDDE
jgi:hypothetical protein